ncbi:MAG: hypothetical protein WCK70_16010 [Chloroflexales bacterium]|jgi:hypothetical protein
MRLAFAPACLPILRGGLPHATAHDALALVASVTPDLPAWPAVPERSFRETALAQAAAGFPGLTIDPEYERVSVDHAAAEIGLDRLGLAYLRGEPGEGVLPADHAAGLGELLRLMGHGLRARALKGEVLGPVSLALQLTDESDRPLAYDPTLREALLHHLSLRIAWHYEQLSAHTDNVIICLDEPSLDALNLPFCPIERDEGMGMIARILADMPGCRGLGLGGNVDWAAVLALPVDLVLLDAYEHGAALIRDAEVVARFLDRGGVLGWGIVPVDPSALAQEHADLLAQRLDRAVDYLSASSGLDQGRILNASLITSNDSLANLSVEAAEQALRMCAAVSRRLRSDHGLGNSR